MKTTDRVSTDDTHLQKVDSGAFHAIKSPAVESDGLELGGALRPGGAPSVFSLKHIGLLAHIASVGVVYGTVYGVIYAVLNNYLAMSATLVATAQALIRVPRALRMIFAVCSDCYPIFGYRRRPYLLIGWIMTFVSCFLMAVWPIGDPATTDPDASDNGIKLIFLMMFANLGTVIAFGASDGYMVELAQREPELTRGTVQSNVSTVRQVFMILSAFMTGLGLNGVDYGGSFSWTMGFNAIMGVCAAFSFVTIPLCWFCITEEKVSEGKSGSEFFKGLFKIIQSRVIFQLIALRFFRQIFSLFSVTADSLIQSLWAKVEPLNSGVADMLSSVISAVSIFIVKKYGLAWDWRLIVITCQVFVVALDCIPTFFTIWNVFRSQWFWLGVPLLAEFPNSIGDFIAGLYVVEVTDEGFEATIMGLMVSISAIGTPFATVMTKSVSSYFDIERPYIKKDDHHVHSQLTYAYIIAYIVNLFSLVFVVFWLPRQKAEVRALKRTGGSNKVLGSITVFYLVFAFCWTVMTNILSLSASTKCLRIAGGTGCK
ncbi:hypothetical protein Poli38472_004371 [Pythium oligandrum]|uniref:Transmembrane protein n=1 Tax=Pythium oligandrum TaxID=41045 RepID=A0A8K1C9Z3_PYTOL|nr:hypothetical protein Poli38472_004371 [Pythium oligandrum]|eukprot:TMW59302.1 hypothetical protein Poli38472_004371 [Pythium oligandrum]